MSPRWNFIEDRSEYSHFFFPLLYFAFLMVGFCTALPGALLTQLLLFWALPPHSSSVLFLLLFLSSCVGSLAVRKPFLLFVRMGALCMATACTALAIAHGSFVLALIVPYGFAFGMMLTSITRLVLKHRQERGVREVNRLNLLWGVGAFFCPAIASGAIRVSNTPTLMVSIAALLALLASATFLCTEPRAENTTPSHLHNSSNRVKMPVVMAFYTFIAVGTEATFGAWSATYSHLLGERVFQSVGTISFFWFGLLSSRALAGSLAIRKLREMTLMYISFSLASIGAVMFLAASRPTMLLPAAFLVGFGLGPIFPTLQAVMLPRTTSNRIFVVGGVASSVLPWLTGVISVSTGSLRTAMSVPALLIFLLVPCAWLLRRDIIADDPRSSAAVVEN